MDAFEQTRVPLNERVRRGLRDAQCRSARRARAAKRAADRALSSPHLAALIWSSQVWFHD